MSNLRPLVNTEPVDEFGAITQDDDFHDPGTVQADLTYVPGWSELRRERAMQMAEYVNGRRLGQDVMSLPVNVRWGRRMTVAQTPDSAKLQGHANAGYRAVNKSDVGQVWLKDLPPGSRVMTDGTIVNAAGDQMLLVCTAQQARKNRRRKMQAAKAQEDAANESSAALQNLSRSNPGSEPFLEKKGKAKE